MPGDDFDLTEAIAEARRKLPMDKLFELYNRGQHCDKAANKRLTCPHCGRLGTFSPHYMSAKSCWTFGCFGGDCKAHRANRTCGGDEIGFVAMEEGMTNRKDAMWKYLSLAGIARPERKKSTAAKPVRGEEPHPEQPAPDPTPEDIAAATGHPPETDPPAPHDAPPRQPQDTPEEPAPQPPDDGKIVQFAGPTPTAPAAPPKGGGGGGNFGGGERARSIWEKFHSLLQLRAADREMLKSSRGFSDELIDKLGFRSNGRVNEAALQVLREQFPMHELLRTGLWKRGRSGNPVPEEQFMGWGLIEKIKGEDGKEEEKWGQAERPLIPYYDRFKRVFFVRPHKGNIAKEDKDDDEVCGGHIYCPFLLTELIDSTDGLIVITESEFKAAALHACGIPALGIPGTGFVRNRIFREELVKVLADFRVREVVIIFDNENKAAPGLPGYKQDPWDRYDVAVWAKYIAWDLMKKTPRPHTLERVRIGQLPDSWRNDDAGTDTGKIDWDTALANFVRRAESPAAGRNLATAEFWKVINEAVMPNEFEKKFYPEEAHAIIGKKLGDLWHEPLLPAGGRHEERMARRLDRINSTSSAELVLCARNLSRALRSCVGTYFERKTPNDKRTTALKRAREKVNAELEREETTNNQTTEANIKRLRLERTLLTELIQGVPEPLSNFTMKCEYCKHAVTGLTERLVRFTDTLGRKTGLIPLDGEAMAGLKDFRQFCYTKTKGVASWRGGEKHLQAANEDMIHSSAHRDIYEVDAYGYHPASKLWFFGDCAFGPNAELMMADDNNVFWFHGTGYQVDASVDERGVTFDQGAPILCKGSTSDIHIKGTYSQATDKMHYLCAELQNAMMATIGDYDGLYAIGMFLSYAVGPELFHARECQPGLWMFGKRASGKTTLARWLMRIWGFAELTGVRIDRGTTHVGMARDLNQNCFLPFWFDEYRRDVDEQKESVLRGAFDRSGASKGMMDNTNKTRNVKARTVPLVTGESSSGDAATRSRYGHVLVAASRRTKQGEKERYEHLQRLSRHFHHIGRWLMEHRADFTQQTLDILDRWLDDPEVREKIDDERTRIVHGIGMAAILALNSMLKIWSPYHMDWERADEASPWRMKPGTPTHQFGQFLIRHSQQAFADVQEETMVNKFWQNIISGINRQEIPRTLFMIDKFVTDDKGRLRRWTPTVEFGQSAQPARRILFMAAKPVYDLYTADVRRADGSKAPLSFGDILRELCKETFWVPSPDDKTRSHRVFISGIRHSCWAIDLTSFPPAEDFEDALAEASEQTNPFAEPKRD